MRKSNLPLLSLSVAAAVTITPDAAAQEAETLEEVVVTATRTAETVDETLVPVIRIDREEIETSGTQTLRELLGNRAGIQLTNQGGVGKNTNLYLRGTSQQSVKFLVNGLEFTSATTGTPAFQFLPLPQIDRVEVVRGPRSSLYGADAVGGIVQVFTPMGQRGFHSTVSVGAGSNQTRKARVGVSGADERLSYAVSGDYFETQGFDSFKARESDDDGFRRRSGNLRLGYDLGGVQFDAHFLHSEGTNEYDWTGLGTPNNETEFVQEIGGLNITARPADFWTTHLRGGRSRDEQQSLASGEETDLFETVRDQAVWQNDFSPGAGQTFTLGGDYHIDRIDSTREYAEESRWNWGVFVQQQAVLGSHDVNLSLRHDDNEAFGSHTTGSVNWGYRLDGNWRVTASYGTAFRAPTFNELYYPDVGYYKGNPELDPETSRSADIGLVAQPDWGRFEVHAFRTEVDDLITNACVTQGPGYCAVYAPVNLDQARITGVEVRTVANLGKWRVASDLTIQDPINRETGNLLPKRSREALRVDLQRQFGRSAVGLEWQAKGRTYDDTTNDTPVPGYGLVHLYANWRVADEWSVRGRLENVLDRDYESESGYRARGRYGVIELAYGGTAGKR